MSLAAALPLGNVVQEAPLEDLAKVVMGQSPPSKTYNTHGLGVPFLQGKAEFGPISPVPSKWCSEPVKRAPKGSTLISVRAPVGDANFADQEYCIGRGLAAVVPGPDLDMRFLYFALHARRAVIASFGTGSIFQSINGNVLRTLRVPLPSLEDQGRIAGILSTIQHMRSATEAVVAGAERLRHSVRQHLFDNTTWPRIRLGACAEIQSGGTPSRTQPLYWEAGTIPWVKTAEIDYGVIRATGERITQLGLAESSARVFSRGTLLLAMYGDGVTRGRVALLGIDAAINQACAAIVTDERIDTGFLYQYFAYAYGDLRVLGHGAHQKNLSATLLRQFMVPMPLPDQQRRVAAVLEAADRKVDAERRSARHVARLFDATLRRVFPN